VEDGHEVGENGCLANKRGDAVLAKHLGLHEGGEGWQRVARVQGHVVGIAVQGPHNDVDEIKLTCQRAYAPSPSRLSRATAPPSPQAHSPQTHPRITDRVT
jgi:hypothetical protein